MARRTRRGDPLAMSLREYGRGLAGGLIFSLPLLYTMEVWWAGFMAGPGQVLAYLLLIFVLLLGYNRYAGLRQDAGWTEVAIDSVEELGLGVLTSAAALFLLGRIRSGESLDEIVGKIVIEAGVVAIGFSVGTAQLGAEDEGDHGIAADDDEKGTFVGQHVIAFCGAVLFAANVAPTEEILVIAVETPPARLLALAVVSIAIAGLILYFSRFSRSGRFAPIESHWQAFAGSINTYAVALIVSALILWFFGRFDGVSRDTAIAQIVVLGLPATLGASAGRLLLQS